MADFSKIEVDEEGRLRCPKCVSVMRLYVQDDKDPQENFVAHCEVDGFLCAKGHDGMEVLRKLAADRGVEPLFDRLKNLN